ncbi:MAG: exonuclease SbcCD subunit D [Lachnospiraceae bacterium]|nr:exonuclease SbcCD subunit D [Lachnospiraceae bacterium]
MKLMHLSDLHIGKRVNEFSMIEDQKYILEQILKIVDSERPDGVLIAGDVYDKSLPSVEGVTLFDDFLSGLHKRKVAVFIVSGNHDSAERINFASRIMEQNKIYIAGTFDGSMPKIRLEDEHGPVNVYLLPFVKPAMVRPYYPDVETYHDAVASIIGNTQIAESERNVLVAHQFITAGETSPERTDSENISIGGIDNIDASVFDPFDYVALGHLHGAQRIGRDEIRYAGSPLKYSFSETRQKKSVTMVELKEKTQVSFEKIPLIPIRDMREIKGPIAKLLDPEVYTKANTLDYIHATLTDEEDIYDAIGQLRSVYPNIMKLDFENSRMERREEAETSAEDIVSKNPLELFEEFFLNQNNKPMKEEQLDIMVKLFETIDRNR